MAKMYIGEQEVAPVVPQIIDKKKYGVSIDNLLGRVSNGYLYEPTTDTTFNGAGIEVLAPHALAYKFYHVAGDMRLLCPDLKSVQGHSLQSVCNLATDLVEVDLSNLEEISGSNCCESAFSVSFSYIKTTGLKKLKRISGTNACRYMYKGNSDMTITGLELLESIDGTNACQYMFDECSSLVSTGLVGLKELLGAYCCNNMFQDCLGLTKEYFPNLIEVSKTNAFGTSSSNTMFRGCTNLVEIHFRADMQAQIEAMDAYGMKFGATNATIYFDL